MNRNLIILIIFLIFLLTFLNGCFGEDKNDGEKVTSLIGSWIYIHGQPSESGMYMETNIYNFYDNSKFSIHNTHNYKNNEYEFTYFGIYNITNNKITLNYDISQYKDAEEYSYQIKNNMLNLTPMDDYNSNYPIDLFRYKETPITYEKISEDKHFIESLNKIEPAIDDLPDGYIKCQNSSNWYSGGGYNTTSESYYAIYFKGNCSINNTGGSISYSVINFKTSNIAHLYYIENLIGMNTFGHFSEIGTESDNIGDESIALSEVVSDDSYCSLMFRVKNVVCNLNTNYSTAYNISKTINEKINLYLE